MVIPPWTTKLKSTNIFVHAGWGQSAKFNSHQIFWLYGTWKLWVCSASYSATKEEYIFVSMPIQTLTLNAFLQFTIKTKIFFWILPIETKRNHTSASSWSCTKMLRSPPVYGAILPHLVLRNSTLYTQVMSICVSKEHARYDEWHLEASWQSNTNSSRSRTY